MSGLSTDSRISGSLQPQPDPLGGMSRPQKCGLPGGLLRKGLPDHPSPLLVFMICLQAPDGRSSKAFLVLFTADFLAPLLEPITWLH